jgi:hypothetical protein
LERDLQGKAVVLRLDVLSTVGGQAADRYGVRGVPVVIVVDGHGLAVFSQGGRIQADAVLSAVKSLLASGQ